jgi:small-conductance mechanosensitive channel
MIVIGLLCMLAIFLLSPLDTDNKTLSQKEKHVYKIISIIIASALMVVALIFILFGNFNVSIPIIFGIVTSSLVLIMRKLQILLNKQPS